MMLPQENLGPVYDKALEGLGSWMPIELIKTCKKCLKAKELEEFSLCKNNTDGRRGSCKECKSEEGKAYYQIPRVKAHQKIRAAEYYQRPDVKARVKVLGKENYEKNKDPLINPRKIEKASLCRSLLASGLKKCSFCLRVLSLEEFGLRRVSLDGKQYKCKKCQSVAQHQVRVKNILGFSSKKEIKGKKKCVRCSQVLFYSLFNYDKGTSDGRQAACKGCQKKWAQDHKEETWQREKKRRKEDLYHSVEIHLRDRAAKEIKRTVKKGIKKAGSAVRDKGCTTEEFVVFFEKKLAKRGWTWEQHGRYGWHYDHIVPLSAFDLTNREQCLQAFHYTNLQPLWWDENLSKGADF